jgi:hypothetical protein
LRVFIQWTILFYSYNIVKKYCYDYSMIDYDNSVTGAAFPRGARPSGARGLRDPWRAP